MSQSLDIVVIGASRCLGRALAVTLAPFAQNLTLTGRSLAGLRKTARLASAVKCSIEAFDLADTRALRHFSRKIARRYSKLDVLALVAGADYIGKIQSVSEGEIAFVIDGYVKGLMLLCKAMLPLLRNAKRPRIFNFASGWNYPQCGCEAGGGLYVASKSALASFLSSLSSEEWRHGLSVTTFYLGEIDDGPSGPAPEGNAISYDELTNLISIIMQAKSLRVESALIMPADPGAGRRHVHYHGEDRDL